MNSATKLFIAALIVGVCVSKEKKEEITVKAKPSKTTRGAIGQGFELHKIDLLTKQLQATGSKIFENLPEKECIDDDKVGSILKDHTFYEDTQCVFKTLSSNTKVEPKLTSLFTLGASVEAVTNNMVSEKSEIQGFSLNFKANSISSELKKDCINKKPLSKDLVTDFEALDKAISKPHLKNSWRAYNAFLDKYGSHIVKSTISGASIYQYVFAKKSKSFKENDLKVKACLSLAGPTNVGKLGVSACSGVTKKNQDDSKSNSMTEKLVIKGGKSDTRVDLTGDLSDKQINKFLKEAATDPAPIQYEFHPIWSILKSRYIGKDHYANAVNLEQYYKGFLDFGCSYEKSPKGLELQKFALDDDSEEKAPTYVCKLGPEGCHNDKDCESDKIIRCACNGPSCIRYNETRILSSGKKKKEAIINDKDDKWRHESCKKKGLKCKCREENKKWGQSWSGDTDADQALRNIHAILLDRNKQKRDDLN